MLVDDLCVWLVGENYFVFMLMLMFVVLWWVLCLFVLVLVVEV